MIHHCFTANIETIEILLSSTRKTNKTVQVRRGEVFTYTSEMWRSFITNIYSVKA